MQFKEQKYQNISILSNIMGEKKPDEKNNCLM